MDIKTFINTCKDIVAKNRSKGQYMVKNELVEYCKQTLNKDEFWVNFEGKKERYPWRMNLTYRNNQPIINSPYNAYCNGLVLGLVEVQRNGKITTELRVASVPIPTLPSSTKDSLMNSDCDVYRLTDGTTVNLYYWNGTWTISSAKAYDISTYQWRGISWFDALKESLEKSQDSKFSFDRLDRNKSYTLVFRHPQLHPFNPEYSVTFIASCYLRNLDFSFDEDIGLPKQKLVGEHNKDLSTHKNLIEEIYDRNQHAYSNWKDTQDIDYGYSVIIKDGRNRGCMVVLPSTLQSKINNLLYKSESSHKEYMTNINFVILNAVVGGNTDEFKLLFPIYSDEINKVSESLNSIVDVIMDNQSSDQWKVTLGNIISEKMKNNSADPDQLTSVTTMEKRAIISSFVFNPINLHDYYGHINNILNEKKLWSDIV